MIGTLFISVEPEFVPKQGHKYAFMYHMSREGVFNEEKVSWRTRENIVIDKPTPKCKVLYLENEIAIEFL